MTNQEYIHINEAVKKRDKTRQTFYNYIHKGLVRTKKINNKVYLYFEDIDQLMQGFIPDSVEPMDVEETSEAQESSVPTVEASKEKNKQQATQEIINIQQDMARLHKQYYSLKDDLIHEVKTTKQDLLFDAKRLTSDMEQKIFLHLEKNKQQAGGKRTLLLKDISHVQLQNKKLSFWIGYCSFVMVNMLVMLYML